MRRQALLLIGAACTLSACFDKTPTRATNFEATVALMNCKELANEQTYQYRVLVGLQKNKEFETPVGHAATTVLSLGYNLASNAVEDSDSQDRIHAVKRNIALIESAQDERKCSI